MVKKALLTGALAMAAVGFIPASAGAVTCLPDVEQTTIDDKYVTKTCWDCGWIMINDRPYTLFHCD